MNKFEAEKKLREREEASKALRKLCNELFKVFYIPQITKWLDKIIRKKRGKRK